MPRRTAPLTWLLAVPLTLAACGDAADVTVVASETDLPTEIIVVEPPSALGVSEAAVPAEPQREVAELVSGGVARFRPETVAVVGDSLTLSAVEDITDGLETAGLEVLAVDAVESRRMASGGSSLPPGVDAVAAMLDELDELPELWVIALGTNDVGAQVSTDRFRDDMSELIELLPDDAPIVWVDVWIRDRDDAAVVANDQIRTVLRRRFGVSIVVDWYSHGLEPGVITGDGVHLTDAGRARFADAIVGAVDTFFPAG